MRYKFLNIFIVLICFCIGFFNGWAYDPTDYLPVEKHYDVVEVDTTDINNMLNSSEGDFLCIYCYAFACPWCSKQLKSTHNIFSDLNIEMIVLLDHRCADTSATKASVRQIYFADSTINTICLLSDSLYDEEYRYLPVGWQDKKFLFINFKFYGGPKEGNKYINFCEGYIPEGFDKEPATPKVILLKKGEGVVFVNEPNEESILPQSDIEKIKELVSDISSSNE